MFGALLAGAVLAGAVAGAAAQPHSTATTQICIDVNGGLKTADCRAGPSRLASNKDVCICRHGLRTEVSVCPEGVEPAAESAAVADFRRQYMRKHNTLIGASYQGRPMCVAPR